MPRQRTRLNYQTAWDANPMDAWATITLLVLATVLSVQRFNGVDYDHMVPDWRGLPFTAWTFLTATLLHGNLMHLVFNLYWTYKFGILLEAMFGLVPFVLVVLLLGGGSSAAQWVLSGPGIGLSGIGYGMFGLLWSLDRWHPECRGLLDKRVAEMFGAWFLLCIIASYFDIWPIANVAHGAGFIIGALLGWTLCAKSSARLVRTGALLGFFALVGIFALPPVRHVLNRSDSYSGELFERGYDALSEGDWVTGARIYEDLVQRDPDLPEAWNNLGIAYRELRRGRDASVAFARSEQLEKEQRAARKEKKSSPGVSALGRRSE